MTNPQATLQTESPVLKADVGINNQSWFSGAMAIAWLLGCAAVLLQMATNGRYGYFRDELYYIATSDHLAWSSPYSRTPLCSQQMALDCRHRHRSAEPTQPDLAVSARFPDLGRSEQREEDA